MAKEALVTGSNKGIGFHTALHLGLKGYRILLGVRSSERGEKARAELASRGVDSEVVLLDLNDFKSIAAAAREVIEKHPGLSLLVNNAGIPGDMACASYDSKIEDIVATAQVNYFGPYALTSALVRLLAGNRGKIVNITVPTDVNPYWHPLAYCASKASLNCMTMTMAADFKKNGLPIETYVIHPGPTTTDLNGNMKCEGFHDADTAGRKIAETICDGTDHSGQFVELFPIVKED
ncbi:MAG: SDR family NAD(P)-dependent oxidoreductase [Succinivibrio sp.]